MSKDFDQSQELQTILGKVYNFRSSPHRISVLFKLRPDFVIWKNGWKVRMNVHTPLLSFPNFCCLSQSEVGTDNGKGSTFLQSNMFVAVVAIVLIWTVSLK